MDFDPNAPAEKPKTQPEWATYVEYPGGSRHMKFKTHRRMSDACSAVMTNAHKGVIMYRFVAGKWVEVLRVEYGRYNGTKITAGDLCTWCGNALDAPEYGSPQWAWVREKGRIADPPRLERRCADCWWRH